MTNDTSLESSSALFLEFAKKRQIGFFAKFSYTIKIFAKSVQKMINCKNVFEKPVPVSLCHRLSKKLKIIKIWQIKVGQNEDLVGYWKK